ncbi:MAG: hypothetical protein JRJ29_00355 [Deltaproteobacteria bacterium]|nr:hypothetical protein [Deltaproteobacteria bacterium]MBW2081618.1 hypothetical protein [Deltaproteobacteria bacterium]
MIEQFHSKIWVRAKKKELIKEFPDPITRTRHIVRADGDVIFEYDPSFNIQLETVVSLIAEKFELDLKVDTLKIKTVEDNYININGDFHRVCEEPHDSSVPTHIRVTTYGSELEATERRHKEKVDEVKAALREAGFEVIGGQCFVHLKEEC